MDTEKALQRELENLAGRSPVARLKAIHQVGDILIAQVKATVDAAEVEQVRALGPLVALHRAGSPE